MYDVIKELMGCKDVVVFSDKATKSETYSLLNSTMTLGKVTYSHEEEYDKELDHLYNNIVLKAENKEFIILQDYGDHEGCVDASQYYEIERALPLFDRHSSIGWFDGHMCLFDKYNGHLFAYKLFEAPKINLETLKTKRPYNFKILLPKEYNNDTKLIYSLSIREEETKIYQVESEFTWGDVTNPNHLNSQIVFWSVTEEMYETNNISEFISFDLLAYLGFDYDAKTQIWSKGNVELWCEFFGPYNNYFYIGSEGGKYICKSKDLKELLLKDGQEVPDIECCIE